MNRERKGMRSTAGLLTVQMESHVALRLPKTGSLGCRPLRETGPMGSCASGNEFDLLPIRFDPPFLASLVGYHSICAASRCHGSTTLSRVVVASRGVKRLPEYHLRHPSRPASGRVRFRRSDAPFRIPTFSCRLPNLDDR
jgi:hypothetical protein